VRRNPTALFLTSCLVIGGVILNRFDVGLIGLTRPADAASYVPLWAEFMVSIGIWSAGLIAFYVVARNLPLFEHHVHTPGNGSTIG
jgi:Ni/Fe-hydrogenase subunit HybB-like protein